MRTNAMKALLKAGKPALGCSIMIPSPQMVEMAAHAGFDWVLIDMEHGTIGLESAELMSHRSCARATTHRPRSHPSWIEALPACRCRTSTLPPTHGARSPL